MTFNLADMVVCSFFVFLGGLFLGTLIGMVSERVGDMKRERDAYWDYFTNHEPTSSRKDNDIRN